MIKNDNIGYFGEEMKMKNKIKRKKYESASYDDMLDLWMEKGLIEKTEYGYYFRPEFFETLEVYEE
ncbi:MAG: hypothetical protein KAV40_02345 [Thermoplasmatales archaeon]|nr:hypothetical protein [Thermoplasmatales archaeon]